MVDEVQYAAGLFRHLKVEIARERERYGRYILTGSQKFSLMHEVSDSLAGRCGVAELEGLSVHELGATYPTYEQAQASQTSWFAASCHSCGRTRAADARIADDPADG